MEKILKNYKTLFIDVLKRIEKELLEANASDIKFYKSKLKTFDNVKLIKTIKNISMQDVNSFKNEKLPIVNVLIDKNVDIYNFAKIVFILIITRVQASINYKNNKDVYLTFMLINIFNVYAKYFNLNENFINQITNLKNGERYNYKFYIEKEQLKFDKK